MGAFLPAKTVSAFVNRWYPRRIIPIQLAVIVGLYLLCCGGESGAYRGLRGAGKLAERPKANRIRIRGRSFLNVLLFSYKETFTVEIGRFLTIVMCDAG